MAKIIGKLINWYFPEASYDRQYNFAKRHWAYAKFVAAASMWFETKCSCAKWEKFFFLKKVLNQRG